MLPRKTAAALRAMRRNGIAWLALFVALGGTGYAAATIGPGDIRDDAVRARHIANGAVGTPAIRDGRVASIDLRNHGVRGVDLKPDTVTGTQVNEFSLDDVPRAFRADSAADAHRAEYLVEENVFSASNNLGVHVPSDGASAPIATLDDPRFGPGSGEEWLFIGTLSVFNDDPAGQASHWRCTLDVAGTGRDQSISLPLAPEGDVGYGVNLSFQVRGFASDEPDPGLYCRDNEGGESVFVSNAAVTAIPMQT